MIPLPEDFWFLFKWAMPELEFHWNWFGQNMYFFFFKDKRHNQLSSVFFKWLGQDSVEFGKMQRS